MVLCRLGMQQYAIHNATIQKTTFFEFNGVNILPFLLRNVGFDSLVLADTDQTGGAMRDRRSEKIWSLT